MKYNEKVLSGRKKQWGLFSKEELIDIIIEEEDNFNNLIDKLTPPMQQNSLKDIQK